MGDFKSSLKNVREIFGVRAVLYHNCCAGYMAVHIWKKCNKLHLNVHLNLVIKNIIKCITDSMLNQYNFRDSEWILPIIKTNSTDCSFRKNISFDKESMWDSTKKGIGENDFKFKFT